MDGLLKVLRVFLFIQKHPDGERPVVSGKKIGIFSFAAFVLSLIVSLYVHIFRGFQES